VIIQLRTAPVDITMAQEMKYPVVSCSEIYFGSSLLN